MSARGQIDIDLHPKQALALSTPATEVLYGGAAGGGKSYLMRVAALLWCASIPGLQVYLFRRIRDDLVKNHMEGPKGFRAKLAPWVMAKFVTIVEDEIRFWNGSRIYLCHCKDEKDIYKYQGAEIHVLLIDELTHFTETMYRFLRNRVRMVGITIPAGMEGKFPRILCGANPGNIGHLFVKATFVDAAQEMQLREMPAEEGGMLRQFIPARLDDNPSMAADDPGYERRLEGLGSPDLVRAMRHGDWDVIEGAFFPEFERHRHVVRPFKIPDHWTRFCSFDWGSAKPFSVGWWALAQDDCTGPDGKVIPRGAIIRYREWYGASAPNVGLKLTVEEVANGIEQREAGDKLTYRVADPSIFSSDGGPSHAERMHLAGLRPGWNPADNKRVATIGHAGGWDQVRARLKGDGEHPMMFVFSTCTEFLRTFPALQHDPDRPEDVDTDNEDHIGDETRYACMSRPYSVKPKEPVKPKMIVVGGQSTVTMDDLWAEHEKKKRRAFGRS